MVHDGANKSVEGDIVEIRYAGGHISARKYFVMAEIIRAADRFAHPITGKIFTS